MNRTLLRSLISALALAALAFAHYTWIAPATALEPGQTATVRIAHGHKFPASEEAVNAAQLDVFAVAPSGAKVKLQAAKAGTAVTASYAVKEAGLHRIAFVQDRGVNSRTPKGMRPGGRDRNPDATAAYRSLRTAVSYAMAGKGPGQGAQAKPVGMEIELVGAYANGAWNLQLLKGGKPAAGVAVEVFLAGADKTAPAGTTDAAGKVSWRVPDGAAGPAMFAAEVRDAPPAGAKYDYVSYSTSLYVSW
jgi:uncharacterized GH25 family protein